MMAWIMNFKEFHFSAWSGVILGLVTTFLMSPLSASGTQWFLDTGNGGTALTQTQKSADGFPHVAVEMPGSIRLYQTTDRTKFRHDRAAFQSGELNLDVRVSGTGGNPLKTWLFAKDKDGNWYQTEQEFLLREDGWKTLSARIDQMGRHWLPVGHNGVWNGMIASGMFEYGISVFGEQAGSVVLEARNLCFAGKRTRAPLALRSWTLPDRVSQNKTWESRFYLTREYFNPFDPDEIEVNYEIELPGNTIPIRDNQMELGYCDPVLSDPFLYRGKAIRQRLALSDASKFAPCLHLRYPAFFGQDFTRKRHFTKELLSLSGEPYWAFRMTPHASGDLRIRLHVIDRSTESGPEEFFSEWRTLRVEESPAPGVIRVSSRNPGYFEFSNGSFFYPVGINIHTNTDMRSETRFDWGYLPDCGTYDYDDYFNACGASGISLVEIWMASWTYAIEWDSARPGFFGLGRYNLFNAWKLDHLFQVAERNGLYLNLVLDAHGKLATNVDQEWEENPFNRKAAFASANGGFLGQSQEFWTDYRAREFNRKRNRYIMARWGANTSLYAIEFWSEVNLVAEGNQLYRSGEMISWHRRAAREIRSMDQAGHLIGTHICGDSSGVLNFRALGMDVPELTHVACNAYRGANVHIMDQLRKHAKDLADAGKPLMIMEYGGTHMGSQDQIVRADIHGGLWGALFTSQAGTPCLWWHDFIHIKQMYPHFQAFARFLKNVDLRGTVDVHESRSPLPSRKSEWLVSVGVTELPEAYRDPAVLRRRCFLQNPLMIPRGLPDTEYLESAMLSVDSRNALGWIYDGRQMLRYPAEPESSPLYRHLQIVLHVPLIPGTYLLQYMDTVTGNPVTSAIVDHDGALRFLPVPDFRVDLAWKLCRIGHPEVSTKGGNAQ